MSRLHLRVGVTGGRDFADVDVITRGLLLLREPAILVHGAAPGADTLAAVLWAQLGGGTDPHPADWTGPCRASCRPGHRRPRRGGGDFCPAAGVDRNQQMLDSGLDLLLAFPGGTGTADMVRRCRAARIPILFADPPNSWNAP